MRSNVREGLSNGDWPTEQRGLACDTADRQAICKANLPRGDKRVERIWRREGLKVPQKQTKKGRLWLSDGSCVRLRPEHSNHVWSYDFVQDRTHDGRAYRTLNIIDEFTKEALMIRVERKLNSADDETLSAIGPRTMVE